MYIYFDSNGYLKEFINDPKREGSQNVNKLYIYIEPSIEDVQDKTIDNQNVKVWMLLNNYPSGTADFRLMNLLNHVTDDDGNILNTLAFNLEEDTVYEAIPYNKDRDLKYFVYERYYQFIKLTIPSEVLLSSGEVACSLSLVDPETSPEDQYRFVLDIFSFIVQNSVIKKNINITQAEYSYLLATKIGIANTSILVDELPETGQTNVFYILNQETEKDIYIWNGSSYVWVGSNQLSLANYYTKSQGEEFESEVNYRVRSVENELASVASGSPKGVYATLAALQAAYPTGADGIYVVSDNGHWYYWNGSAWTDGGAYLSITDLNNLINDFHTRNSTLVGGISFTNKNISGSGVESASTNRVGSSSIVGDGSDYDITFVSNNIGTIIYEVDGNDNYTAFATSTWTSGGNVSFQTRTGYTYKLLFRYTSDATFTVQNLESAVTITKNPSNKVNSNVIWNTLENKNIGAGGVESFNRERILTGFFKGEDLIITKNPDAQIGYYIAEYTSENTSSLVNFVVNNWNGNENILKAKLNKNRYYKILFKATNVSILTKSYITENVNIKIETDLSELTSVVRVLGISLSQTNINGATGVETTNEQRVSTDYIIGNDKDLVISIDSSLKVFGLVYDVDSTVPLSNFNVWNTASKQVYSLFKGYRYRFIFAKVNDTTVSINYVQNNILLSFEEIGTIIPSYYESEIATKIQTINTNNKTNGTETDSFVFITDVHFLGNSLHSPALIKEIKKHTSVNFVVNGGDIVSSASYINTVDKAEDEIRQWTLLNNKKEDTLRGNHDRDVNSNNSLIIPNGSFYDICLKDIKRNAGLRDNIYYYIDNSVSKIRYIFMDSGDATITALDSTQLQWLKDRMIELQSGWGIVIFQHMVIQEHLASDGIIDASLSSYGTTLKNAILDVLSTIDAELIAVVCGHTHRDYNLVEDGILFISTTCDTRNTGTNPYDINFPTRTINTVLEQAFDVYTIDKSQRKIKITRIGAGNNREFNY